MQRRAMSTSLLVLLLGILTVLPGAAEPGTPRMSTLKVSMWPEYDEPRVLVMYEGALGPSVVLPQTIRLRVPKGAEVTEACALKKPNDEHLCQLFETSVEGDFQVVSYEIPVPDFFLQLYYNPISGAGQRTLDFSFLPAYPVDNLALDVQQPARSSDFAVSPATPNVTTDQQGFKYFRYAFTNVAADQPVVLKVSYGKADAKPSVAKAPQQGSTAPGASDPYRPIWIIVAVGMAGAVVLIVARQRLRARPQPAPATAWPAVGLAQRRMAGAEALPTGTRAADGGLRRRAFCTQCGGALRDGGRFCPACGAQVGGER